MAMINLVRSIRSLCVLGLILGTAILLSARPCVAGPVLWGSAMNISSSSDVSTVGNFSYGYNWYNSTVTVNGVTFTGAGAASVGSVTTNFATWYNGYGGPATATGYSTMLNGAMYTDGGASANVTLNNLTPGRNYLIQYWTEDPRTCCGNRTETLSGGVTVTLAQNTSGLGVAGNGQYAIGYAFVDSSGALSFSVSPTVATDVGMNAIQVRDVTFAGVTTMNYWTGNAGSTLDSVSANFSTNAPAAVATFDTLGNATSASQTAYFGDYYYSSGSTVAPGSTSLTVAAGGVSGGVFSFINNAQNYTLSGADSLGITGTSAVAVSGSGSVTFNSPNTYTGGTFVSGGSLVLATASAVQGTVSISGGQLILANSNPIPNGTVSVGSTNGLVFALGNTSVSIGGLAGGSGFALLDTGSNAVALTIGGSNASTAYSGAMTGPGSITKVGTGTLTLTGASTFSGGVNLNGGIIATNLLSSGTSSGLGASTTMSINGGILNYTGGNTNANPTANNQAFSPTLTLNTNGGTINVVGSGFLAFAGALTGSGNLTIVDTADTTGVPGNQLMLNTTTPTNGSPGFTGNIILGAGGNIQYRTDAPNAFGTAATVYINGGGIFSNDTGATLTTGGTGGGGYQVHGYNTLSNPFVLNGGSLATQGVNVNYAGNVTITGGTTSYIGDYSGSNGSLTIGGSLLGSGTVSTIGTQVVTLSGATSGFTGTWQSTGAATTFMGLANGSTAATWIANGQGFNINNSGNVDFGALSGTTGTILNGSASTASTLSVGALGTSTTFGGSFANGSGTLTVSKIGGGNLTLTGASPLSAALNINGGTLSFASASAQVVSGAIGGSGPVVKNLAGALTINSISTYSGGTTINAGSLVVNGALNPAGVVTLAGGLTLSGSGSVGPTTLGAGGIVANTAAGNSLTLAGLTYSGNGSISATISPSTSANVPIIVSGGVTAGAGSIVVNTSPTIPANGTYHILSYGSGGDPLTSFVQGRVFSLAESTAGTIDLVVNTATSSYPIWTGLGNGSWDYTSANNWIVNTGGATNFQFLDHPLFDDTAGAASNITINNGNVQPLNMTFNNNTSTYVISGSNGIIGTGSLTLNGPGSVTISTSNGYSGGTVVNNGVLTVGNVAALGTGPVAVNGGTLRTNGLSVSISNLSGNAGQVVNGSASAPSVLTVGSDNSNQTFGGSIANGGAFPLGLTKAGNGTFTLSGANTYSGTTTISSGVVQMASPTALGTSTVSVGAASGLAFATGNSSPSIGGLAGGSAFALQDASSNPVTLTVGGNNASTTYTGAMSGSGGLVKTGTGTLMINGANGYTGPTTIQAGTLKLQNGSIPYRYYRWNMQGDYSDSGGYQISEIAFYSSGNNPTNGTRVAPVAATGDGGGFGDSGLAGIYDNNVNTKSYMSSPFPRYVTFDFGSPTTMTGYDWATANDSTPSRNPNNWQVLGSNDGTNFTVLSAITGAGATPTSLYTYAAGWSLPVAELSTSSAVTIAAGATFDLNASVQQLASLSDYSPGSSGSIINSNTTTAATLLLTPAGGTTTFSGLLAGGGTLGTLNVTLNGPATFVFPNSNTFTGQTTISSGTLLLTNPLSVQNSTVSVGVTNGLAFALGNTTPTLGGLAGGSNFVLQDSGGSAVTLAVGNNNANTNYSGAMSGNGGVTKIGTGTQTLSGVNSFTGPMAVNGGALTLTTTNNITGPITINSATLTLPGGVSGNPSLLPGNPSIFVNSGGTLAFSGYTTFGVNPNSMPAVTVNAGGRILSSNTVELYNNLTLNSGTVSINGNDNYGSTWGALGFAGTTTATGNAAINVLSGNGSIQNGNAHAGFGTFTVLTPAASDSLTISAPLISGLSVVKQGGGLLTLSSANSFGGPTTISAGTLQLGTGNSGQDGSLAGSSVTNNGTLVYNLAGSQVTSYPIGGSGGLTKSGSGILILGASNSYSGATVVNQGTLKLLGTPAYRYYQFKVSTNNGDGYNQIGELHYYSNGVWVQATTGSASPTNGSPGSEQYWGNANDNKGDSSSGFTKFGIGSLPYSLTYDFGTARTLNSYNWSSANDSAPGRNPTRWVVYGSNDGSTWQVLDDRSGIFQGTGPTNTYTWGGLLSTSYAAYSNSQVNGGSANAIPLATTGALPSNTALSIGALGAVDLGGVNQTVGSLSGAGTVTNSLAGTTSVLAAGGDNSSQTFSGVFTDGAGAVGLRKQGAGSLLLTSNNPYSGGTTVNSGTLQVGNGGSTGSVGSGAVTNNGVLALNRSDAGLAISGAIGGSGAVYQIGSGTTTLAANNGYSGGTVISSGVLQVGAGTNAGTFGSGTVTNNGAVIFNRSDAGFTVANAINGSGSVTQNGVGTVALNGTNGYSGATNVNSGGLYLNGPNATTAINVVSGATLGGRGAANAATATVQDGGNIEAGYQGSGSLTLAGLNFLGGSSVYVNNVSNYQASAAIKVTGSNGLSVNGYDGAITFYLGGSAPTNTVSKIAHLVQYSGTEGGNANLGTAQLNFDNMIGYSSVRDFFSVIDTPNSVDLQYSVDYPIWTGAGNGVWALGAQSPHNWKTASSGTAATGTDFLSSDAVVFDDSAGGNTTVNITAGNVNPSSVTFNNNTASYVIQGTSGIAGNILLSLNGSGTVTISNANSFYAVNGVGGALLNAGRLNIGNAAALGSGNGATLTINGGSLDNSTGGPLTTANLAVNWNGPFTFVGSNPLNLGTGPVTLGGSAAVNINNSTLTLAGPIADSGQGFTLSGAGTLLLLGSNTYTGPTVVNGGTLQVGDGGSGASINTTSGISLASNTALLFDNTNPVTMPNPISGAGQVVVSAGFVNLASTNSYTGGTTVGSGAALQLSVGGPTGTLAPNSTLTVQPGGYVLLNASNALGTSGSATYLTVHDGTAFAVGLVRVPLWNPVNLTGGTLASAGGNGDGNGNYSLSGQINATADASGNPSAISATQVGLLNNTVLNVTRGSGGSPYLDLVVSSVISSSNSGTGLTIQGNGNTQFTGANTYNGGTTVTGGMLQLGSSSATLGASTGGLTVASGGIVDLNGFNASVGALNGSGTIDVINAIAVSSLTIGNGGANGTFSGTLQNTNGTLALVKTGSGTQYFNGTSTYAGGTTLQGGVLNFTAPALPASSPNITFAGGTLQWATGNTADVSGGIAPIPSGAIANLDTNGNNVTFASSLSGAGGLSKIGAGTLTLPVPNTFTGPTTISGGTLNVAHPLALQGSTVVVPASGLVFSGAAASASTLGGLSGPNNLNLGSMALTVGANNSNALYDGVLSGGASLTKIGSGTWTISASQNYSGPTTIGGGTLRLLSSAGAVSGFGGNGTGWTVNSSAITSTPITADVLTLTDNGSGEARSAFWNVAVPTTGSFTANYVYQAGGNIAADGVTFCLQNQGLTALGGAGGSYGYGPNGTPITPSVAVALNLYNNVNQLQFMANGSLVTSMSTNAVSLHSGDPIDVAVSYDAATQLLALTLTDTVASTSFSTSETLPASLQSMLGSTHAYIGFTGGDGGATATQTISGFSFASSVTGSVNSNFLPVTTPLTIGNGGTFDTSNCTQTVASLSSTDGLGSKVLLGSAGLLGINGPTSTTFDGVISGGGSVVKQGGGVLTFTGLNTYTGPTKVTAGTLQLGDNVSKVGSVAGNIALSNNAAVVFATPAGQSQAYAGVVSGTGSLTMNGQGIVQLTGNHTYNGPTTINSGVVRLGIPPANISGFGGSTTGGVGTVSQYTVYTQTYPAWTFNSYSYDTGYNNTPATSDVLDLTDGVANGGTGAGCDRTAFYNTKVPVNNSFRAKFTYTDTTASGDSQCGFSFIIQNDSRGAAACSGPGSGVGVGTANFGGYVPPGQGAAINNSAEIEFTLGTGSTGYNINGATSTPTSVTGVSLTSGDPIIVTVDYNATASVLTWTLSDAVTNHTQSFSQTGVNLQTVTGGASAYVGFGGSDWYVANSQDISNFNFASIVPPASNFLPATTALNVASGGTLDLFGNNQSVGALTGNGVVLNSVSGSTSALTVGADDSTQTFAGTLQDAGGLLALVKTGSGTLTLTGTNTYTGGTIVANGTLVLTNNEAIADGTSLTVGDASAFAPAAVVPQLSSDAAVASASAPVAPVPEPGTLLLLAFGVGSAAAYRRWRQRR